ncbi:MAG TPA: FGGY family carbohydrate kinase [Tepidisphaeraceae bacterium]|jgi:xylulokinase|nr:FGGY family carbohydrate kinase [Tepidisphaeraceae bacterium]
MTLLGIDIGSSSVKCALLRGGRVVGKIVHAAYDTHIDGPRAEVDPGVLLKAISKATREVGAAAKKAEAIALSVFSPGWIAMDKAGEPLTPIVTHQDRRSVDVAIELEKRVGPNRYLKIAGTRPFPGGISSTTWAWYLKNEPGRLKKADLVGHLNTFLHRQFTGSRVVDTANASFMGVYSTCDFSGWSDELCDSVGASRSLLPQVFDADRIGGALTRSAATRLGLTAGTPVTVGVVDGSAAMLATGAAVGQLLNVCGSTDVLALCTDRFAPYPQLLTRALGIGPRWLSVSTIAAAGSAIKWARERFFHDYDEEGFQKLVLSLARQGAAAMRKSSHRSSPKNPAGEVHFDPYLAGDRMSIEQKQAAFTGLTLATTRRHMLAAMLESLASASAARLDLLKPVGTPIRRSVVVTGGAGKLMSVFHRDWPGKWSFRPEEEATLRGLSKLEPKD